MLLIEHEEANELLLCSFLPDRYGTWNFGYWKSRGVSGPPPTPFFGNTRSMVYKVFKWNLYTSNLNFAQFTMYTYVYSFVSRETHSSQK